MAIGKKSFILYCDQKGLWEKLDNEQAGKLIKHIISYVNDENPEEPDFVTGLAFEPIKQHLKRDLKRWEKQQLQRSKAGKKSAEVRKRNATSVNERSISSTDNVSVSVSVNDSVSVNVNDNKKGSDFDIFWMGYGKKVDLIPCQREWLEIDKAERSKILKHVPKFVAATPDIKFRKSPLKYLKDRTWMDEHLPTNSKKETETPKDFTNVEYP